MRCEDVPGGVVHGGRGWVVCGIAGVGLVWTGDEGQCEGFE